MTPADAWTVADPTLCEICGRESCEDHLPAPAPDAPRPSRLIRDVDVLTWAPPVMLVGDRIPRRALVCLYGPSGLGKTFVALDLALSHAAHRSWLGAALSPPGRVVYIATEGTAHVSVRLRGWFTNAGLDLSESVGFYLYPDAVNLLTPAAVVAFIDDAAAISPTLIVVDTLARCIVGADENSAKDMGLAIEACDRIRRTTAATVLLVHHTGKDGGQERGSSALRGAADTVLALTDDGDSLKLTCDKQKDGPPFEAIRVRLVPVLEGATCVASLTDGTAAALADLTGARLTALDVLRRICAVDGPVTRSEWFRALPPKTVTDRRFYDVVNALLTARLVEREGKKRFQAR
jgi:hypothetical protein